MDNQFIFPPLRRAGFTAVCVCPPVLVAHKPQVSHQVIYETKLTERGPQMLQSQAEVRLADHKLCVYARA